jgi:DHA2 family methylenomycin A resistance protein-like MFS transporter
VGWWGASGAIALAAGPVLGGLLVDQLGWRSIFRVNLPIGLLGMALALRTAPGQRASQARGFDWAGQGVGIIALASLAGAVGMAADRGWGHATVLGGLGLALAAAVLFVAIEARAGDPMLPLDLFGNTVFSVASLCGIAVNFAYYGLIFVFSLFFQVQMQLSPGQTGLAFLPMTLVLMVANVAAGQLMPRWGTRRLMVSGLLLAALGYGLLWGLAADSGAWRMGVPMLLAATGIALTVPTMTNATLSAVQSSRAGIASGVLNSARQVGGMLGVAVCSYLVRDMEPLHFAQGMRWAIGISVVLLVLVAGLCQALLPPSPQGRPGPDTGTRAPARP